MTCRFLTVKDVLLIHKRQIEIFGGGSGIRDRALLESAVAQAMATFDGKFRHSGIFSMASAYLYHIVKNHPFVDGNKRTGLMSSLIFLGLAEIGIYQPSDELYKITIATAEGKATKEEIADVLRSHAKRKKLN